MKNALFALVLIFSVNVFAADEASKMDPKKQEMMKKMIAAGTPGKQHKMLADLSGEWKTSSQMWESPDSKPETSIGNSIFKMILGGRWLQQDFKGTAMGQPFEGIGFLGYDNVKEKYISHWIDTMSTGSMVAEGDYDKSNKTLKDKGSFSCPITPSKKAEVRTEWNMSSKNKMIFSMFGSGPQAGPEFKMMEIVYTR